MNDSESNLVPMAEFFRSRHIPLPTGMAWLRDSPSKLPPSLKIGRRRYFPKPAIAEWEARLLTEAANSDKQHTRNSVEHRDAVKTRSLLSMHSAAIIAGMSAAQLRRTDVPRTKVGRREYIAPDALRVFLETQRTTRT